MFILNVNKLLDLTSFLPKLNYVFCALNRILMVHDAQSIKKSIFLLYASLLVVFIIRNCILNFDENEDFLLLVYLIEMCRL